MFRSFIYLNEEKMYSYLKQIDQKFAMQANSSDKKTVLGASIGVKGLNANAQSEVDEHREIIKDSENDYDKFEKALDKLGGTEYFDFVLNTDYFLKTVPQMSIIRYSGRFQVPEQFDMFSIASRFMPLITSQIKTDSNDGREVLNAYLGHASADIPIIIEDEEVAITGRLSTAYLLEDYADLEDYSEQEVFVLCKVIGLMNKDKVEIFNPLKDFIKLPRALRRNMDSNSAEFEPIVIDGPVLKTEVIAIYK